MKKFASALLSAILVAFAFCPIISFIGIGIIASLDCGAIFAVIWYGLGIIGFWRIRQSAKTANPPPTRIEYECKSWLMFLLGPGYILSKIPSPEDDYMGGPPRDWN